MALLRRSDVRPERLRRSAIGKDATASDAPGGWGDLLDSGATVLMLLRGRGCLLTPTISS